MMGGSRKKWRNLSLFTDKKGNGRTGNVEKTRLLSALIFVLAAFLLLGLFLVPIANYYQDESQQQGNALAMARANAQVSRTIQAAYVAQADSILALSMYMPPSRPNCDSTRACLEESLLILEKEVSENQFIAASEPKTLLIWKQGKEKLNRWKTEILRVKPETMPPPLENAFRSNNALFVAAIADLEMVQSQIVSSENQLKAAIRSANETQMMRVFFLECSCLGLMSLSSWHVLRILYLKDRTRKAEHLLSRAEDAIDDRVRNMLQLINSLIAIQKEEQDPVRQQYALENIASDIRAIATVHSLQGTARLQDAIPVDVLLRRLTGRSLEYLPIFRFEPPPLMLSVRRSTSLALIVNELLIFALRKGVFLHSVELQSNGQNVRLELCFSGNLTMDRENTSILMVNTLVHHDLAGEIQYEQEKPQITICFPCDR